MDKIDEKYKKGKIYTIRCRYDDDLIYVGSTIQELSQRMTGHRRDNTCSLYQLVKGDWDNWYIELYEEYPCNNKSILVKREGEITRQIGTINKNIAGRTKKEWEQDNLDKIVEQKREWYQDNKDKVLKRVKQYNQDNKEKISEKNKVYYEANKEQIGEKNKLYREENKDKIKEYNKGWYETNKDKIEEYHKGRYEANRKNILEKNKVYYEKNKEQISEKNKQKVKCHKCGCEVCLHNLTRHKKSKKCLNYNVNNN